VVESLAEPAALARHGGCARRCRAIATARVLRAKCCVAGQCVERATQGVALGLLDLEHCFDVLAREVLGVHERRDKVAILVARESAEHCHES
jgi:hypothetical protein